MSPLRLVLVTQRFWPLMGRAPSLMANLASELALREAEVTVLTARWHPGWPAEITFREVPVVRVAKPPGPKRDTNRYVRAIARWLRQRRGRYDLVCVSELRYDAYAVLAAVGKGVPVVLRAETAGRLGDCLWQLESPGGPRVKQECTKASALIGPSRAIERELIAAGYPRDRVHYLPNGAPIPPPRSAAWRTAARAALTGLSSRLRIPKQAPLVVSIARLDESKGLGYLVAAWPRVLAAWPEARLWLVGEGPRRKTLENQIVDLELLGRVFLPGVFDSVDELLAAADVFVLPCREEGPPLSTLEAMAAGLPIVTSDLAGNRELVTHGEDALLVPDRDVDAIAAAILHLLDEPDLGARLGAAARQRASDQFSLSRMVDAHVELFESVVRAHRLQVSR